MTLGLSRFGQATKFLFRRQLPYHLRSDCEYQHDRRESHESLRRKKTAAMPKQYSGNGQNDSDNQQRRFDPHGNPPRLCAAVRRTHVLLLQ
jgi:hypothetical protein